MCPNWTTRCLIVSLLFLLPREVLAGRTDLLKGGSFIQTGADNDLTPGAGLFRKRKTRSGNLLLVTKSQLINIHAHSAKSRLENLSNYTYTGQFRITANDGGVGVTFHSQYPEADAYYRLRRYSGNAFHIAPHGTSITSGTTDTGVTPKRKAWYKFKVRVTTGATSTRIRAKVWRARKREPRGWQVDCEDSSGTRFTSGKVGVWSMADGRKLWRDLKVR